VGYLLKLSDDEGVGVVGHGAAEVVDCPVDEALHFELAQVGLEVAGEVGRCSHIVT
jgi:hypothetical protein